MKTITFTDFRKKASGFITLVEHGERFVIVRHGKPVAEMIPFSDKPAKTPAWKQKGVQLQLQGTDLSYAILEDRADST
ncbi:type II toxin-antitoxin system Phd/YefM family antitoxin [Candidatus Leptofilum sp.]|uniref:type II toxin-antitoxin system Phd/YefM family antitoxin n=1 Tax=Candidatus Leptofilum sp. TaxID=3241576 RepID=UPI003B58C336